jgi:uncharacterized protein YecE (DUF72 family)
MDPPTGRPRSSRSPTGAAKARVGCSGWVYREWRGLVYPPELRQRDWFGYYSAKLDTVEINNTFYRLPTDATVDAWRDQAPEGFCYALKVGQFGTHRKKLRDASTWLARHLERVERLGGHLGPNLVQLPPNWRRDVPRLDDFLAAAPGSIRWAVEVRDPSWLHDEVFDVLCRHGAALCIHDLIEGHPWEITTDWTYVRFHGPHATESPYHGRYGGRRLWRVADRLAQWRASGCDVYAYFNNDVGGHAFADATWLRDRLEDRLG